MIWPSLLLRYLITDFNPCQAYFSKLIALPWVLDKYEIDGVTVFCYNMAMIKWKRGNPYENA